MRFLFLLIVGILYSCNSNLEGSGYKVSFDYKDDYELQLDKGGDTNITMSKEELLRIGIGVKSHNPNGTIDTVYLGKDCGVIEPYVEPDKVNLDSTFILASQKPLDQICEYNDTCLSKKYGNIDHLPTIKIRREALEKSTFRQYWIINKKTDDVYGPYQKDVFVRKCNELGVPKTLKLKE